MKATAFAPGSIGNVGPGFDVLGLAVEGIGDTVSVELTDGDARVENITGRDAGLVPRDPAKNVASIAAAAWLLSAGIDKRAIVSLEKGLALAGGMGGSAASAVAGAYAAALAAFGGEPPPSAAPEPARRRLSTEIMSAALEAESTVAGRHLDNIAASTLGGLTISRSADPIDAVRVNVPDKWSVVLITPHVRIETKAARAILPSEWPSGSWVQQMANTTALAYAFASGDEELVHRSLDDRYAEPLRAKLIPRFREVKRAALEAGALGCSISGSGPTIFAITRDIDHDCAAAMKRALGEVKCDVHVARIAREGVRRA